MRVCFYRCRPARWNGEPRRQSAAAKDRTDLRTLALAYTQVAAIFPGYREEGFRLLTQAARDFPDDAEIQQTYGLVLLQANPSPRSKQQAAEALERAISLNSKPAVARTQLAELRAGEGNFNLAAHLLDDAIRLDAFYPPAYLDLAQVCIFINEREKAIEVLKKMLAFDPENEAARKVLENAEAAHPSR